MATPDGILTPDLATAAWRSGRYVPRISAIAAENTHNASGGRVMSPAVWDGLVALAGERGVPIHLDGARLWNAAVALGEPPARLARGATTVMVSLSKGLGCPVGSCLAGSRAHIERAWQIRKRLGGGMRQTGILAAAGLYALDHHLDGLAADHANARFLAERLEGHAAVRPLRPETNIVMLDLLRPRDTASDVVRRLAAEGVLVVPFDRRRLRAVTHRDVSRADVERAVDAIARVLA